MARDISENAPDTGNFADVPSIPPEEMAEQFNSDELHSAMSLFKGFAKVAKRTEDPDERAKLDRKARYWREVADLVSRREQ